MLVYALKLQIAIFIIIFPVSMLFSFIIESIDPFPVRNKTLFICDQLGDPSVFCIFFCNTLFQSVNIYYRLF